ncbi:hypothetical protein D3C86_1497680 [compost metagenome]
MPGSAGSLAELVRQRFLRGVGLLHLLPQGGHVLAGLLQLLLLALELGGELVVSGQVLLQGGELGQLKLGLTDLLGQLLFEFSEILGGDARLGDGRLVLLQIPVQSLVRRRRPLGLALG